MESFRSAKNENGNRQRLRYFKTDPLGDVFFFRFRVRLIFRHGRYKNKHILGKFLDFIVFLMADANIINKTNVEHIKKIFHNYNFLQRPIFALFVNIPGTFQKKNTNELSKTSN